VWRYGEPIAGLIRELKFGGRSHHRFASADFFATALQAAGAPPGDVIVPVPLSAVRLRQRGFNQALELARPLARALALPLDSHSLVRHHDTAPQSRLPWRARQANVRGAFAALGDFTGRHVIVVDDVMTTGATLDAVARTLKDHGAAQVSNWVVARALKPSAAAEDTLTVI
jgi:ComF family protein